MSKDIHNLASIYSSQILTEGKKEDKKPLTSKKEETEEKKKGTQSTKNVFSKKTTMKESTQPRRFDSLYSRVVGLKESSFGLPGLPKQDGLEDEIRNEIEPETNTDFEDDGSQEAEGEDEVTLTLSKTDARKFLDVLAASLGMSVESQEEADAEHEAFGETEDFGDEEVAKESVEMKAAPSPDILQKKNAIKVNGTLSSTQGGKAVAEISGEQDGEGKPVKSVDVHKDIKVPQKGGNFFVKSKK